MGFVIFAMMFLLGLLLVKPVTRRVRHYRLQGIPPHQAPGSMAVMILTASACLIFGLIGMVLSGIYYSLRAAFGY